jgi:hypothetical protein
VSPTAGLDAVEKRKNSQSPLGIQAPNPDRLARSQSLYRLSYHGFDELYSLYFSPNIVRMIKSRRMRWAGHVACMGEGRGVYRVLIGRPEGKRPLGRPMRRWEDNIKMDLREIGIDGENWIRLAQDKV